MTHPISPIGMHNQVVPLQPTSKAAKASGAAASTLTSAAVASPVSEKSETPAEDAKEASAQKNTAALSALVAQETAQVLAGTPRNIVSPQDIVKAYQQSK